jgi:hypothetical protein
MELPGRNACRIVEYRDGDIHMRERWADLFQWLRGRLEAFDSVFGERVHGLVLEPWK